MPISMAISISSPTFAVAPSSSIEIVEATPFFASWAPSPSRKIAISASSSKAFMFEAILRMPMASRGLEVAWEMVNRNFFGHGSPPCRVESIVHSTL